MQRTTWECDRCHKQYHEGDARRPGLPDRWRQIFKGSTLTVELCDDCGAALLAFCEGSALIAGTVEPVKLSAAVLRLQQMHAKIANRFTRPELANQEDALGDVGTVLCEVIELLLEAVEQQDKPPATCMCGHSIDIHLPPEAFPSGCACIIPSCGCLSFISAEPPVPNG